MVWQLAERLEREAAGDRVCGSRAPNASPADRLMTAAYVLTGLRQGRRRFGEVDEAVRQQIETIRNIDRLEDLTERLLMVSS
ncbi:MAG: hypothetical protein EA424_21815 [Planctomycetaceae bacterium]|nr:MAG: hypothetical protein EA424_21815 [Planctomycetaceae bacterium]